jgi:hypothetical protein
MADKLTQQVLPFLPDWPSGPLSEYRQKATIDWRSFKLLFEDPDCVKLKHHVWLTLSKFPFELAFHVHLS